MVSGRGAVVGGNLRDDDDDDDDGGGDDDGDNGGDTSGYDTMVPNSPESRELGTNTKIHMNLYTKSKNTNTKVQAENVAGSAGGVRG